MRPRFRLNARASLLVSLIALWPAVSVASAQPFAYVMGQRDDPAPGNSGIQVLTVINTATNTKVATLPLGLSCTCVFTQTVAIAPDGARVYVANYWSNTVSVIDTSSNSLLTNFTVGENPGAVLVSPDGLRLFVLDGYPSYSLSIFETATNTKLTSIPLGVVQSYAMDITPDSRRMFVSTYGGNSVKVVDLTLNSVVATIPVGNAPLAVDVTPDGSAVYVANIGSLSVSVISTATNAVAATLSGGWVPATVTSVRVTPDGTRAYVAAAPMSIIDTQTRTIVGSVAGASQARAMDFIPDGSRAYLATTGTVQVINTLTNSVSLTIPFDAATEGAPNSVAIAPPQPIDPPSGLEASSNAGNAITLRWVPPAKGPRPTHYVLEGGVAPGQVLASISTGSDNPTFLLAAPTGAFYIRMHAMAGTQRSAASNEILINVNQAIPPSAPTNLTGLANGASLTLAWRNDFNGGAPLSLTLDVTGSSNASLPLGVTDNFAFSGVPPGTYTFSLRATNASGSSAASNAVTLTFPGVCAGPPQVPPAFVAYRVGTTLFVRWETPASGPAPASYRLNVSGSVNISVPTTARFLSGAAGPGTYGLSVAAVNPCGIGPATPVQSVVIP